VKAEFTPAMRPFLLQLKRRFTQYNLQYFVRLSSQYSMRIYELLKMRQGLRFYRIPVTELRELLKCKHSYARFRDFRRATIDRAQRELREKTDIRYNYKVEREGQSPVRVCFIIKAHKDGEAQQQLIQRDPTAIADIGVEQSADDASNGSSVAPSINIYAMILNEMTQSQLDQMDDSVIRRAIENAKSATRRDNPGLGSLNIAQMAFNRAKKALGLD